MIRLSHPPSGFQLRIFGRIHHGLTGLVLTVVGVLLAVHDRKDWRLWIADLLR